MSARGDVTLSGGLTLVGAVHEPSQATPSRLVLLGRLRSATSGRWLPARVAFSGATRVSLPDGVADVHVLELPSEGEPPAADPLQGPKRRFRLQWPGSGVELAATAVQVQTSPGDDFYSVLPRVRAPLGQRAAWAALLAVLRIPGAAGLLTRLRNSA